MKRFVTRLGRVLTAAASAGVLITAGLGSPVGADQPLGAAGSAVRQDIITPGVPATVYWPPRDVGIPNSVFEYRLTPDYWERFRECRVARPFQTCADTVLAQYEVRRIQ